MSGQSERGSVLPVLGVALAVSVLATWYALGPYFHAFNTPHAPIEGIPHRPSSLPVTPGLARRVVVVLADGVSFEAARALPELAALRRAGVLRPLQAEFPTFTAPALTALVTGLSPRDSGTRLNGGPDGVTGLDSVLRAAGEAGVSVRLRTREWEPFPRLMRPPPRADIRTGRLTALTELVTAPLSFAPELPPIDGRSPTREITAFYIGDVDEAAHRHGIRSSEYDEAAHLGAALINRVAGTLDLEQDSLVVLSDHGHRPEGGHGGMEPLSTSAFLLAAGGLFRHGVEIAEARPLRDVAPTLSVLAGVRVPSSNLGRPMLDLLSVNDVETSVLLAAPFDQAAHFLCQLSPSDRCAEVDRLVARLRPSDPREIDPAAWEEAVALHDALTKARDEELEVRAEEARRRRFSIAVGVLAVLGALAAALFRRRWGKALASAEVVAWALPFVNAGVYAGLLYARGYEATFSTMKAAPQFIQDAIPPAIAAAAAVVAVSLLRRPGRAAPWILMAATTILWGLLAVWVGWDPAVLPPPVLGILVFELGPGVISAALGAVGLSLIGAFAQRALPKA